MKEISTMIGPTEEANESVQKTDPRSAVIGSAEKSRRGFSLTHRVTPMMETSETVGGGARAGCGSAMVAHTMANGSAMR